MRVKWFKFAVIIAALLVGACGDLEKMKELPEGFTVKCNPNPVEVHGDKVKANIEGTIPGKYFNKKATVTITPYVVYNGGELALTPKMLQGEDVQANNQVIPFEAGGSWKHEVEYDYKDEMFSSYIELRMSITYKDETADLETPQRIALGTIATYKLVETDPMPSLIKDEYVGVASEQKEAKIQFVVRKSDIRKSELTKDDVKALNDFLVEAAKADNMEIKGLNVSSYASPEGPVDFNEKLSADRGKNTDKYLADIFKKAKVNGIEVSVDSKNEDWDGFQAAVQGSDIEDKELILRVLSMYSDLDVREKEIRNMSKVYRVLEERILPELRRSVMTATVDVKGLTDEELKQMGENNNIDNLREEELLHAAALVQDDAKKIDLYTKAGEKFNSVRGYNNAAAMQIKAKDASAAKALLDKIPADDKTPAVLNNRGCIAMLEGNFDEAKGLFVEGANAGDEAKYNLGIMAILNNEYPAALEYLGGTDSFNHGLAALLNGKLDAAKNTFAKNDSAKDYYGRAIVAARQESETEVIDNLRTAISKDKSLKDRALKDAEFRVFAANEIFKALF
ncbi:MAG: hypothetical protein IJU72_06585 [Bacteroidales bacterium]|nr:hypothetical protein [Bacteroidales bacterium]